MNRATTTALCVGGVLGFAAAWMLFSGSETSSERPPAPPDDGGSESRAPLTPSLRGSDAHLEARLVAIERTLARLAARLEAPAAAGPHEHRGPAPDVAEDTAPLDPTILRERWQGQIDAARQRILEEVAQRGGKRGPVLESHLRDLDEAQAALDDADDLAALKRLAAHSKRGTFFKLR